MSEQQKRKNTPSPTTFSGSIANKAKHKLKAKQNPSPGIWFGLGKMGLIGWSVVIPTLLGAAIGLWIDNRYQGNHSWTLMLLLIGLIIGCLNAWHWISREDKEMHDDEEETDE